MSQTLRAWRRIALAAAIAAGLASPPAAGEPLRGTVLVLDGDTLELGHLRIRLFGVDAPELDQICWTAGEAEWPCGIAARDRLAAMVEGREIGCRPRERDSYGRLIARCFVEGQDLGAALIAEGLAWAYLRFSWRYAEGEATARAAGLGIWQGAAQAAWHYRSSPWTAAAGRAPTQAEPDPAPEPVRAAPRRTAALAAAPADEDPPEGCVIKGNIGTRGERVYHLPGSRWYERTVIEPVAGERWFCNAAEAEAAGWRPAAGSR